MTPTQRAFFDRFEETLRHFLEDNHGTSFPFPIGGDPISKGIKKIIDDCPNRIDFIKSQQIKIEKCPLSIVVIEIVSAANYLNGIWIIVSDGKSTLAFHFPLNQGINVILKVYFENDPILLGYFIGANPAPANYHCLHNLYNHPYLKVLIPVPPANPVSVAAFIDAFKIIFKCCMDIFCSP